MQQPQPQRHRPWRVPDPTDREGHRVRSRIALPFTVSLLLHIGLIIIAVFAVWSYQAMPERDEQVIPVSQWRADAQVPPFELTREPQWTSDQSVPEVEPVELPTETVPLEQTDILDLSQIGRTSEATTLFAPPPEPEGIGVGLYGVAGNARTIVYLVDASGDMIDIFAFIINELKRSIRQLGPEQRFNIIFFQEGKAIEVPVPQRGLKPATVQVKQAVADWISVESGNIVPCLSTDPAAAIRQALGYQPDLVYLLSANITGREQWSVSQDWLLNLIRRTKQACRTERTRINTLQFVDEDPLQTLKLIAEQHGGIYRFISEDEVIGQ
jgi:hypothetical protein